MFETRYLSVAIILAGIAASPAMAKGPGQRAVRRHETARQVRQHERIKEVVKSGELTKPETKELRTEEREIRKEKREAKADGKIDKTEAKEIQKDQNAVSKDIYEKKHNDEKR